MDLNGLRPLQQTLVVRGIATSTVAADKTVFVNFLGTTIKCRATRSVTIGVGDVILALRTGKELVVVESLHAAAPTADPSETDSTYPPNPWASVQNGSSVVYPVKTRTYRETLGWRDDTFDLLQGKHGSYNHTGCAFYGDRTKSLLGVEVLSASIKVKRDPGSTWSPSNKTSTLRRFEEKTLTRDMVKDKTAVTFIDDSITGPRLRPSESQTFALPAAWAQAFADGTAGGIAIHTTNPSVEPRARLEGMDDWSPAMALTMTWRRVI